MEEIFRRRSIHKYIEQKIPDDIVEYLLRAAMVVPSAGTERGKGKTRGSHKY